MSEKGKIPVKAILLGDNGVGKTTLLSAIIGADKVDLFNPRPVEIYTLDMLNVDKFIIHLWDLGGKPTSEEILRLYILGAKIIVLVFDLSNVKSLENVVEFWVPRVKKYASKDAFVILVGNKSDIRVISKDVLDKLINKIDKEVNVYSFVETSAKQNRNVSNVLKAVEEIANNLKQ